MVQNISYSYDEENHHVNKLTEDSKTMFEAVEYAKVMERTTVAIKTMQSGIWSTTPLSTKTIPTTQVTPNSKLSSSIEERRYEVHQPPPVFAQISPSVIPGPNVVPPVPNLPQIPPPLLPGQIAQVINAQAANSSLEQLGCGFDWLTNSCKDVFGVGW
uniref:Uncharacterized protein n=1 Tax=Heterorhabditis bacteriophora TaxID=37862 RepID=A0A1I7XL17_HETBA